MEGEPLGSDGLEGVLLAFGSFRRVGTLPSFPLRLSLGLPCFGRWVKLELPVHLWKWREPPAKALDAKNCLGRRYPCRRLSRLLSALLGCSRC